MGKKLVLGRIIAKPEPQKGAAGAHGTGECRKDIAVNASDRRSEIGYDLAGD